MGRNVIDLTHPVTHQMGVFPADPPVGILNHHNYGNGYYVNQLIMGTHSGTHVDAPIHKIPGTLSITDIPVDRYIGWRTAVIDFTGHSGDITVGELKKYDDLLTGCDAILFKTGWGSRFGKEGFFENYPGLELEVADYLANKGILLIGLETPSVHPVLHQEVHTALLKNDIYIIESLNNVEKINAQVVELHAVPLKLQGLDGSPVRAYAIEND